MQVMFILLQKYYTNSAGITGFCLCPIADHNNNNNNNKNEPSLVNFKFAKFHCYQQTQSFLITP
jgi:hypothetical protein